MIEIMSGPWQGSRGEIVGRRSGTLRVKTLHGVILVSSQDTIREIQQRSDDESPLDFSSSGLGIGGLAHYEEKPIIPSARALERHERKLAQATTCHRCGQTDVFDGAMFTTGGGDICDDCFG